MGERFSDMEKAALVGKPASLEEIRPSEWDFLRRLREYPELKAKIETLLAIIENAGGDVEKAAEAERRSIEGMRKMGNEVMHSWARHQQQKKEAEYQAKPGMNRKEKNLYGHTRLGKIEIAEQIFTQGRGGPEIRPFSQSAEVKCRECSPGLQRAMVDFGADHPFAGACTQWHEHYGIEVPVSAVRMTTLPHGAAMLAQENEQKPSHELKGAGVAVVIAEMDGSMLPVVETGESKPGETAPDRRKNPPGELERGALVFGAYAGLGDASFWRDPGQRGGSRRTAGGLRWGSGWRKSDQDPWRGRWGGLDHRANGAAIWRPSPVSGGFLSSLRLSGGGRRGDRGPGQEIGLDGREEKLAARESLAEGSRKFASVFRRVQRRRPGSGSRLLSLYLQPLEFPGLQKRAGGGPAHRFGGD